MNTKEQFNQRVNELVSEWKSDQDKVLFALSTVVDRLTGNDDKGQTFMTIYESGSNEALGATIDHLIEIELLYDASQEVAIDMEKEMDAYNGYTAEADSESQADMRDAGQGAGTWQRLAKPGDF